MSESRKMRRQAERAQKKSLPPVPAYAEQQNLAWIRCLNQNGNIVAVVEDKLDYLVIVNNKNFEDFRVMPREQFSMPGTEGGTMFGEIMVDTIKECDRQTKQGTGGGLMYDSEKNALLFKMDPDWMTSILGIERELFNPTIQ